MLIFEEIMDYYDKETTHKSKKRDQDCLNRLKPFFTNKSILDLTRADIREYANYRLSHGVANATVNRELRYFSAAINFYRLEHMLDFVNPTAGISLVQPDPIIRYITPREARSLYRASTEFARSPHLPSFIVLALNTGCRKTELYTLEWSRVDFSSRLITLGSEHTKASKRRFVPMNDRVIDALNGLKYWNRRNRPNSPYVFTGKNNNHIVTLTKGFRGACKRAGIDNFRIHDMRHTFASWLVQSGESLYVVKDLLGHSSISVTERYAHLSNEPLQKAVHKLPTF